MIWKFRRFDFDQIRFHVFDNSITNAGRQKIDNGGMDFRRRREGPAFLAAVVNNFGDLIGQLFVNPAIGFGFSLLSAMEAAPRCAPALSVTGKRPAKSVTLSMSLPCASVISKAWTNFKLGPRVGVSLT